MLDRRTAVVGKVGDTNETSDNDDAVTQYTYDDEGRTLTMTVLTLAPSPDPPAPSMKTTNTYDKLGRMLTSKVNPDGANLTTTYTYDGNGNAATVTGANGNVTTNTYDAANRRTGTTDSVGAVETLTYDTSDNVLTRANGAGNTTTYVFDALDRNTTATDPLSKVTTYTYNKLGYVLTVTDANSHVATYTYDNVYRRSQVKDALNNTVDYTYDGVGNLLTQVASNGAKPSQTTTYTYDNANRRATEQYPDDEDAHPRTRTSAYNAAGNVTQRTDQNGDITSYSYGDLHRLIGRSYTVSGSSPTYPPAQGPDSFTYDRASRMLTATRTYSSPNPNVPLAITYDYAGRVTQWTTDGRAINYAYTVNSTTDRRDVTYPGGRVIRENYDKRGRANQVIWQSGGSGTPPVTLAGNTYDLADRITRRDFGNTLHAEWAYDAASRVSSVKHLDAASPANVIAGVNYGRDSVGNPLWREDLQIASHSERYWYDAADRLTDFKRGTLTGDKSDVATYTPDTNLTQRQTWTLDSLGNWDANAVRKADATTTENRTNNKVNEYLVCSGTGIPTVNYAHDDNGNLKDDGTYLYEYDIENRLTRVKRKSDSAVIGEYFYDALGKRTKKVVSNSGSLNGTFAWVWNDAWQLLEIRSINGSETVQQEFVHAGPSAYIDDHVAYWNSGTLYYYHADAQYCTLALTNASGNVSERYDTDAYGKALVYDSGWTLIGTGSAVGNPFMHQGLPLDAERGSYQNRWREFRGGFGRFLQRDPPGYGSGATLYVYLDARPTTENDPSGLIPPIPPTGGPRPGPKPPSPGGHFPTDMQNCSPEEQGILNGDVQRACQAIADIINKAVEEKRQCLRTGGDCSQWDQIIARGTEMYNACVDGVRLKCGGSHCNENRYAYVHAPIALLFEGECRIRICEEYWNHDPAWSAGTLCHELSHCHGAVHPPKGSGAGNTDCWFLWCSAGVTGTLDPFPKCGTDRHGH